MMWDETFLPNLPAESCSDSSQQLLGASLWACNQPPGLLSLTNWVPFTAIPCPSDAFLTTSSHRHRMSTPEIYTVLKLINKHLPESQSRGLGLTIMYQGAFNMVTLLLKSGYRFRGIAPDNSLPRGWDPTQRSPVSDSPDSFSLLP